MSQLDLFIHGFENNQESQQFLNENRYRLSQQCKKVLELLEKGIRLTTANAPGYGILSLCRRIKDLKDYNGIQINETWVTDQEGKRLYKMWYL